MFAVAVTLMLHITLVAAWLRLRGHGAQEGAMAALLCCASLGCLVWSSVLHFAGMLPGGAQGALLIAAAGLTSMAPLAFFEIGFLSWIGRVLGRGA